MQASDIIFVLFSVYFAARLLIVSPLYPRFEPNRPLPSIFVLLLLCVIPIVPLFWPGLIPSKLFLISYVIFSTAAIRFSYDSPLLQHIATSYNGLSGFVHASLLLWRIDLLAYFVLFCLANAIHGFTMAVILYTSTAVVAIVLFFSHLYTTASALNSTPSFSNYVALIFHSSQPSSSHSWNVVPPNVRTASAFTLLSFDWVTSIVTTGRARALQADDVVALADRFRCKAAGPDTLNPNWQRELDNASTRRPSVLRALFRSFGLRLMLAGLLKLINDVCIFISPMLLRQIILHLQTRGNGLEGQGNGLSLAFGLLATYLIQSLVFNQYFNIVCTVQILMQGALVNAVFVKSTRLSPESRSLYTSGQIQNLMSTDSRTVSETVLYIHMLWSSLEQIVIALVLLVRLLGYIPTAAGILFIIASMPLQSVLVRAVKRLREEASARTDERVKSIAEVIKGIKLVKLYAWELSFVKHIIQARARELNFLKRMAIIQAWNSITVSSIPTFLTLIVFVVYSAMGRVLDAAVVFPAIALFNVIRPSLIFFPTTLINAARAAASLSRLGRYLRAGELVPLNDNEQSVDQAYLEVNKLDAAAFDASFTWDASHVVDPTLSCISMQIPEGSLVAIVGPTGGGKSTLLAGLLGELPITSGRAGIRRNRTISFCDQVSFIQNATVRDNILFGCPFNEEHYWRTIEVCSLQSDLDILPAGDMTEIGGRGINLSGGQRARVSLARAVYSKSDICLLDDPLSAVDAHVGKSIFYKCIVSQLHGTTRILTTNQLQFATSEHVDIIVIIKDGTIVETGSPSVLSKNPNSELRRLLASSGEYSSSDTPATAAESAGFNVRSENGLGVIAKEKKKQDGVEQRSEISENAVTTNLQKLKASPGKSEKNYGSITAGRLTKKETKNEGRVGIKHYLVYLRAMGLWIWAIPLLACAFLSQLLSVTVNLWLSIWSEQKSTNSTWFFLVVFLLLGFLSVTVYGGSAFCLAFGSIRASIRLHEKFLLSVMGAPSSFFNATPDGRIINRFNSDLDKIDSTLAPTMHSLMRILLSMCFTLLLVLWATPGFIFIAVPIAAVCLYVQEFYRKTSVDLRRLESLARSPLYAHFAEVLDGVVTIRAYGNVSRETSRSNNYTDRLNQTTYATTYANRWLAVRLETLGTCLIFGAASLTILSPPGRLSASLSGLVLSYTIQILGVMTWSVRQFTACESQFNAVERINEYSEPPFPQEEVGGLQGFMNEKRQNSNAITLPESMGLISNERISQLNSTVATSRVRWPKKGKVEFEQVVMKYREDLDPALKGISFTLQSGEHVGIVGRTGAGKSSAVQCLFRLYELNEGRILIDGKDISSMRLFDLRSSLGVIPQEPVCFSGTIRSNLDMFEEYDNVTVQNALDSCGLQGTMRHKVTLDYPISENGSNLSVGQRQLLCLGRALLKDSQVLILDEATSSVSNETDEMIQQTLNREMQHCTTLTVAHRLNTVIQNDRIIVMEKGRIAEMGTPAELLSRPSLFGKLVDETGPANAAHLRHLATNKHKGEMSKSRSSSDVNVGRAQQIYKSASSSESLQDQDSLRERVLQAFEELQSAVSFANTDESRDGSLQSHPCQSNWRRQIRSMIGRLNAAVDAWPADDPHGSCDMTGLYSNGREVIATSGESSPSHMRT